MIFFQSTVFTFLSYLKFIVLENVSLISLITHKSTMFSQNVSIVLNWHNPNQSVRIVLVSVAEGFFFFFFFFFCNPLFRLNETTLDKLDYNR